MTRTQQTGVHDANANAASAPNAPPAVGEDNDDILPNGEEEDEARAFDNINALIRMDMIAIYVCVLGFKEGGCRDHSLQRPANYQP